MTPGQKTCQNVDACMAVTVELVKLMRLRLPEDGAEFEKKCSLHAYLDHDYTMSIFGFTLLKVTVHSQHSNHSSKLQSISAKRAEAVVALAAKTVEIDANCY